MVNDRRTGHAHAWPVPSPTQPESDTRTRIMQVAERLFAERGIDGVPISEIVHASGQRNKNAVNYHFGDREGLVLAIAEHRSAKLNARREALLERAAHDGPDALRDLCAALVVPLAELLDDEDNEFLGFLARYHLDRSRRRLVASVDPRVTSTYTEASRRIRRLTSVSRDDFEIRFGLVLDMIFTALAGQLAQERAGDVDAVVRRPRVVINLVDCAVAAFAAPQHPEAGRP